MAKGLKVSKKCGAGFVISRQKLQTEAGLLRLFSMLDNIVVWTDCLNFVTVKQQRLVSIHSLKET